MIMIIVMASMAGRRSSSPAATPYARSCGGRMLIGSCIHEYIMFFFVFFYCSLFVSV